MKNNIKPIRFTFIDTLDNTWNLIYREETDGPLKYLNVVNESEEDNINILNELKRQEENPVKPLYKVNKLESCSFEIFNLGVAGEPNIQTIKLKEDGK